MKKCQIYIYLLVISLITSCVYQKKLEPIIVKNEETLRPFDCSKNTFGTLNENLDIYYKKFVLPFYDSDNFDTRVDYLSMLELKQENDRGYNELRCSIINHIKDENLLNKSIDYIVAFYLNAYNFLIIDVVIEVSNLNLIDSVADIGGINSFKVFGPNGGERPFYPIHVAGTVVTLNDIEHNIVRPLLNNCDGRVHFAFICASIGCPILSPDPYREKTLQNQLDEITKNGLRLTRIFNNIGNKTHLSQIFNWYGSDMICEGRLEDSTLNKGQAMNAFIQKYSEKKVEFHTENYQNWIKYDWNLNKLIN